MQARPMPFYAHAPIYFSLLLLVAFIGFFPSYFGRLGQASLTQHMHGVTATLWLFLLIGQGWLMRQRKLQLHRAIGKASIVLALLFVVSGLMMTRAMLTADSPFAKMFGPRLAFIDLASVLFFMFAYGMAIHHRKNVQLHARYMVCTALPLLPPALARGLNAFVLPAGSSFELSFHLAFGVAALIVVALIVDDWRKGKVYAPYPILLAVMLIMQASYEVSMSFAPWAGAVRWLSS